jgi:hypothetical protein
MNRIDEIKQSLTHIAGKAQTSHVFTAEVVSASSTSSDAVVAVKYGEMILTGVKLFSIVAAGGLLVKPAVGSTVTVLDMSRGQFRDLVIIKTDTPELVRMELNGLTIEADTVAGKVAVSASGVSLKGLMQSLATIIKQLTVSTPAGPSGTPLPPTMQAVVQFETDFKKLLK